MPIYFGSNKISEVYKGGTSIKEVHNGSDLVFSSFTPQTIRFDYTGDVQTFTVPSGCNKLIVDCVGAAGYTPSTEYATPSFGGRVECELSVKAGETLYIYVGQAGGINVSGWNGGGGGNKTESYSGGGGASDIRISGTGLEDRKIVAGASGGGDEFGNGGFGGGLIGGNARNANGYATGGTQTAGGTGGNVGGGFPSGGNGSFGVGGYTGGIYTGGAGGGGWYGGGGGASGDWGMGLPGAGGSSYTDPDLCTNVVHTQGYSEATGNGWIIITTAK